MIALKSWGGFHSLVLLLLLVAGGGAWIESFRSDVEAQGARDDERHREQQRQIQAITAANLETSKSLYEIRETVANLQGALNRGKSP